MKPACFVFHVDLARCRPISAFEFVTDHSGPAADAPLLHRAAMRVIKTVPNIFGLNMKAVDVVEPAVPRLSNNGQTPPVASLICCAVFDTPGNHRVTRYPNAVCVCDDDRPFEKSALVNPRYAGHFTVTI